MPKVFVSGADGLLGSMICRILLNEGYQVTALCLPGSKSTSLNDLPVEIIHGNICDQEQISDLIKGHDYVIHSAADTTVWPRRNKRIWNVNYDGTMNIKAACIANNVKRLVYIGSASAFKEGKRNDPGNEQTLSPIESLGMDYIESKQKATLDLIKAYQEENFPVIVIAPTFMIGPYDFKPGSGQLLINMYNKKLPGYTSGGKNFVYSGDVAAMAVRSLTGGQLGESYIIGGENLSYKEFFKLSHDVFGRNFKMMRVPSSIILGVGVLSSVAGRILPIRPKISYSIAKKSIVQQYFSTEKAQRQLDYSPSPVKEAIKESLEWFKSNGYIE